MKKFEYKTLPIPTKGWLKYKQDIEALDVMLNEHGKQGWELVVTVGNIYNSGSNMGNILVMKREINR